MHMHMHVQLHMQMYMHTRSTPTRHALPDYHPCRAGGACQGCARRQPPGAGRAAHVRTEAAGAPSPPRPRPRLTLPLHRHRSPLTAHHPPFTLTLTLDPHPNQVHSLDLLHDKITVLLSPSDDDDDDDEEALHRPALRVTLDVGVS